MERIICLVIGYAFGLFQTSYFYGKAHGIDIRQYGSGNAGTTNALRVLGTRAGLIVLAGDCLKCMAAVWVSRLIFGQSHPDMIYLLSLYTGAGAILGHNFPFYMNFRGGKGIAATAGLILSFHPYFIVMGVAVFFGIFFTTHLVSLGSLLVYLGFVVETAPKEKLYARPAHPYTEALLSAVPIPDPTLQKERIILEGDIPSTIDLPAGCPFAARCKRCTKACLERRPETKEIEPGHFVACHLY